MNYIMDAAVHMYIPWTPTEARFVWMLLRYFTTFTGSLHYGFQFHPHPHPTSLVCLCSRIYIPFCNLFPPSSLPPFVRLPELVQRCSC